MIIINSIILIGRLTKDPELRYIPGSNTPVANFTVAVDRDYTKKDGTRETDFIPVETIGKAAEFCSNYLSKGRLIAIQGAIKIDRYEKDGEKKSITKVNARKVKALDKKDKGQQSGGSGFQEENDDILPF